MTQQINGSQREIDLSGFSKMLLKEVNLKKDQFDLRVDSPLFSITHPALLKTQLMFDHHPTELKLTTQAAEWNVRAYRDFNEAESHHVAPLYGGHPWQIARFLKNSPTEAFFDFGSLGIAYLNKESLPETHQNLELHHYQVPLWVDYALSPELWGLQGKWVRFHQRLLILFDKYGLLAEPSEPGYYQLKKTAQKLEDFGFIGSLIENKYCLVFPWDFPLSALKKLEKIVSQEL